LYETSALSRGIRRIAYKLDYFWAAFGAVDTCYSLLALNSQEGVGVCSASEARIEVTLLMRTFIQGFDVTNPCDVAFCS
jgi:hypothetical protein